MTIYNNYMHKTKLAQTLPKEKKTCIFETHLKVTTNDYA